MNNSPGKINTINPVDKDTNQHLTLKSNELEKALKDTEKLKRKKNLLQHIIFNFFNSEMLSWYCGKGWKECTDWSDLYILTKEGIIKVWCWEFNSDTFINWVYYISDKKYSTRYKFNASPLPLYVVNQQDSYLAGDKVRSFREENPVEYLEKYTVLWYDPQEKSVFSKYSWWYQKWKKININKDTIIWVSDAILLFRNKFIENFDKELLNKYMSKLQKFTLEELKQYAQNSEKITDENESALRHIIYNKMWCSWSGAWICADEAIKSRYDLIQSFDTDKWEFTSIPEFTDNNQN